MNLVFLSERKNTTDRLGNQIGAEREESSPTFSPSSNHIWSSTGISLCTLRPRISSRSLTATRRQTSIRLFAFSVILTENLSAADFQDLIRQRRVVRTGSR